MAPQEAHPSISSAIPWSRWCRNDRTDPRTSGCNGQGRTLSRCNRIRSPGAGGLALERNAPRWVGGRAAQGKVLTSGPRIKVPARTLLAFQIAEPIRLTGFR